MASTFPAAIANEPPPLDVSSDDEDSEDFRSHGLKLDVPSGEPTPVSTPYKIPFNKIKESNQLADLDKTSEELVLPITPEGSCSISNEASPSGESNETKTDKAEEVLLNGIDDCSSDNKIDRDILVQSNNNDDLSEQLAISKIQLLTPANLCDTNIEKISESDTPETVQICNDAIFASSMLLDSSDEKEKPIYYSDEASEGTEDKCQESSIGDQDAVKDIDNIPSLSPSPLAVEDAENEEEFQDFQTTSATIEENSRPNIDEMGTNDSFFRPSDTVTQLPPSIDDDGFEEDDFGAFQSIPNPNMHDCSLVQKELDDDDDFGDFAHTAVHAPPNKVDPLPSIQKTSQTALTTIEDFADFQDCPFQSCDGPNFKSPTPSVPTDLSLISSKIDSIVKSLFVTEVNSAEDEEKPSSIDCEISMSSDSTWSRVQDFEGSHGLMFKWLSSLTGKRFLRSLNINTNNIVYHEKWGNIEVPKFAASLIQSPLQPQSCNKLESKAKSYEHPAIVNNNTIISDEHNKPPTISVEAQEILRQLPDLSYMRANTLVFPPSSPSGL